MTSYHLIFPTWRHCLYYTFKDNMTTLPMVQWTFRITIICNILSKYPYLHISMYHVIQKNHSRFSKLPLILQADNCNRNYIAIKIILIVVKMDIILWFDAEMLLFVIGLYSHSDSKTKKFNNTFKMINHHEVVACIIICISSITFIINLYELIMYWLIHCQTILTINKSSFLNVNYYILIIIESYFTNHI